MAQNIVFEYTKMADAETKITELAGKFKAAGDTLDAEFTAATVNWEGESKEKMQKFMNSAVKEYTTETLPKLLESLAELLKANAEQMQKADKAIADSIPTSLKG